MRKIILTILICFFHTSLYAETVWEYVDKKLEKKEFERWSLSSWLYDKQKFVLQDQWLAMNIDQDGLFWEFYADYAKSQFDIDTANNLNEESEGYTSEAAVYLSLLGLSYRYEKYNELYDSKELAFNLRLVGTSHQSTHLIVSYGKRNLFDIDDSEDFIQSFYGVDISLYLVSFFGFDARYRAYQKNKSDSGSYEMESQRTQWGAFIDLAFLRVFAYQFEENFEYDYLTTGDFEKRQSKGTAAGIRVYF